MRKGIFILVVLIIFLLSLGAFSKIFSRDSMPGRIIYLEAIPKDGNSKINMEEKIQRYIQRTLNTLAGNISVQKIEGNKFKVTLKKNIMDMDKIAETLNLSAEGILEFRIKEDDGKYGPVLMNSSVIKSAKVEADDFGKYSINFELDDEGTKKFAEITRNNKGKQLAIMLDGKEQSAPLIQSEILEGKGSISGDFDKEKAISYANMLNRSNEQINIKILEIKEEKQN